MTGPESAKDRPDDIDTVVDIDTVDLEGLGAVLESELTEQPDDRVSPLILSAAVIGLLVGLFVWGSLAFSLASSTEGMIDDLGTGSEGPSGAGTQDLPPDCDTLGQTSVMSSEQQATYDAECVTPEVQPGPAGAGELNRADCEAIQGTDYRSVDEREWFIANCLTR